MVAFPGPQSLLGFVLVSAALPAYAQRADENAVTSAADAFGTSVGNEQVGIYNPFLARGFSPVDAGNVRIEGLYFDLQADLSDRLVSGWSMHVGLSAQGYPFPAPTGVADYALREAGDEAVLSTLLGYGPYGGARIELDGQLPLSDRLSVAAGAGVDREAQYIGGARTLVTAALIPRWRPSEAIEIVPFWSLAHNSGQEAQPFIFTAGAFLPPKIERRRYFGPEWADNSGRQINYGLLGTARFADWDVRAGLFRSLSDNELSFAELALNTTEDGIADRYVIAQKNQRFASVSGELRATRRLVEGNRRHSLHLALRGRQQDRRFGGGDLIALGRRPLDEEVELPEPDFVFGPQTRDDIEQYTAGVGYELLWRERGELAVGLQKTEYSKRTTAPTGELPASEDSPWLYNAALSLYVTDNLVLYGSYARGLEESPVAPEVAVNRDEAPPAILTRQWDAGLRWAITRDLRLVAGVFDVTKPYFALDRDLLFRELGEVRHRGIELSLAGNLLPRLYLLAGNVLLDAQVSGAAVEQGLIGREPIGEIERYTISVLQYSLAKPDGLSLDLTFESTGERVADRLNRFVVPPRSVIHLGARYRFRLGRKEATLRGQVGNVFNNYGFGVLGEGLYYNLPRRFSLSLVADI